MELPHLHTIEEVAGHLRLQSETLLKFCREKKIRLISARPTFLLTDDDVSKIIEARRTTWHSTSIDLMAQAPTGISVGRSRTAKESESLRAQELRDKLKQKTSSTKRTKTSTTASSASK